MLTSPATPVLFHGRKAYATKDDDNDIKSDFKAQLWESTSARINKEREEQERFAESRLAARRGIGGGGAGNSLGIAIGMSGAQACPVALHDC